jgi:hypothetical protein
LIYRSRKILPDRHRDRSLKFPIAVLTTFEKYCELVIPFKACAKDLLQASAGALGVVLRVLRSPEKIGLSIT